MIYLNYNNIIIRYRNIDVTDKIEHPFILIGQN